MLVIAVLTYSLAFWLGAYLLSRNPRDGRLALAGTGLLGYAVALGLSTLAIQASEPATAAALVRWQRPLLFVPALCWLALLVLLLRGGDWHSRLQSHPKPLVVVVVATIFFGLAIALVLMPFNWLPRAWLVLGMGVDIVLLGLAVAFLDAFDEGEALLPDFLRSLTYAFLTALVFGGQVVLIMALSTGVSVPMLALLFGTITAAVLVQTFAGPLQTAVDRLALAGFPGSRRSRAGYRAAAAADLRRNPDLDLEQLDPEEFARLTRRALSQMGNLPRLAASPLMELPLIDAHLGHGRGGNGRGDTLERARVLRQVLADSIARLKPATAEPFGTSDEWRYYNALYFPYVVGIKPYSRRQDSGLLGHDAALPDTAVRDAIDWFQRDVPQRTLYNWQNAAARLVAQDLREKSGRVHAPSRAANHA